MLIANPNVRKHLGCGNTLPADPRYCAVGVEVPPDPEPKRPPMGGGIGGPAMPPGGGPLRDPGVRR